jgi:hypothetical protein
MEFVCKDPNATVRAANVRSTLDAFHLVPSVGRRLVEAHRLNLSDLRPDNFVLVQRWLDVLKEIQVEVGAGVVQQVGARIIENAEFPPQLGGVETVLLALDEIYHLNHRGEVGHYVASRRGDGAVVVRCETPYPRHFERGLVEGICRNAHAARGRTYQVDYEDGPPGGEVTCTLTVHPR